MNEVARVRPADPIAFIIKYLRDNNPETLGSASVIAAQVKAA